MTENQNQFHHQQNNAPHHQQHQNVPQPEKSSAIKSVERITVWVMVGAAIFFALISILAIWDVFGDEAGDVVWRSLATLGVIAFAALIINIGANILESKKK